jgi:hypothetical protein
VVTDEKVKVTDFDEKYGHGARRGMHIRICNCNPSRIVWEKTEEDERDSSRANWEQADPLPPTRTRVLSKPVPSHKSNECAKCSGTSSS